MGEGFVPAAGLGQGGGGLGVLVGVVVGEGGGAGAVGVGDADVVGLVGGVAVGVVGEGDLVGQPINFGEHGAGGVVAVGDGRGGVGAVGRIGDGGQHAGGEIGAAGGGVRQAGVGHQGLGGDVAVGVVAVGGGAGGVDHGVAAAVDVVAVRQIRRRGVAAGGAGVGDGGQIEVGIERVGGGPGRVGGHVGLVAGIVRGGGRLPGGISGGGRGGGRVQVVTRSAAGRGAMGAGADGVLVVVAVAGHLAARVGRGQRLAGGGVGVAGGVAQLVGRRQGAPGRIEDRRCIAGVRTCRRRDGGWSARAQVRIRTCRVGGQPRGHVGRIGRAVGPPRTVNDDDRGLDGGVRGLHLLAVGVEERGGDVVGLSRGGRGGVQRARRGRGGNPRGLPGRALVGRPARRVGVGGHRAVDVAVGVVGLQGGGGQAVAGGDGGGDDPVVGVIGLGGDDVRRRGGVVRLDRGLDHVAGRVIATEGDPAERVGDLHRPAVRIEGGDGGAQVRVAADRRRGRGWGRGTGDPGGGLERCHGAERFAGAVVPGVGDPPQRVGGLHHPAGRVEGGDGRAQVGVAADSRRAGRRGGRASHTLGRFGRADLTELAAQTVVGIQRGRRVRPERNRRGRGLSRRVVGVGGGGAVRAGLRSNHSRQARHPVGGAGGVAVARR